MSTPSSDTVKRKALDTEYEKDDKFRVLCLDGGGAKGFYTLGVLREIEGMLNCPLYKRFDLVYGTSTGAIIAALIALGFEIDQIHDLYKNYVVEIVRPIRKTKRSAALARLSKEVFGDRRFDEVKTGIGIVTTKWELEKPMIFKGDVAQAFGRQGTFEPGFGITIGKAVEASCSAYPFFCKTTVTTQAGNDVVLVDGGFCANNPTLYAIADAVGSLGKPRDSVHVVSVGVGVYPEPKARTVVRAANRCWKLLSTARMLLKTLEINTQSMEQLRSVLFKDIKTVRISETFQKPEMAADLLECNLTKLNLLRQLGGDSFEREEEELRRLLC